MARTNAPSRFTNTRPPLKPPITWMLISSQSLAADVFHTSRRGTVGVAVWCVRRSELKQLLARPCMVGGCTGRTCDPSLVCATAEAEACTGTQANTDTETLSHMHTLTYTNIFDR